MGLSGNFLKYTTSTGAGYIKDVDVVDISVSSTDVIVTTSRTTLTISNASSAEAELTREKVLASVSRAKKVSENVLLINKNVTTS